MTDTDTPDLLGVDYDPVTYWRLAGDIYEETSDPAAYRLQDTAIEMLLGPLQWRTVLDVGCGYGRLGEVLGRFRPDMVYTGLDISPAQIAAARRRLPGVELHETAILDFDASGRQWDLVVCAEVLMHQPARLIVPTVQALFGWSRRWLLTQDWWEAGSDPGNAWNVPHDYPSLYGDRLRRVLRAERQGVFLVDTGDL